MTELVYKKECYEIVGCCYEVFNQFGFGLREKNYQKAIESVFDEKGIKYESQLYVPLKMNGKLIGKYFLDLFVFDKIAVELKVGNKFFERDIEQLRSYLKSKKIKLGLLVNFTSHGVEFMRVLNLY